VITPDAIAPVISRIADIQARFTLATSEVRVARDDGAPGFGAALVAAQATGSAAPGAPTIATGDRPSSTVAPIVDAAISATPLTSGEIDPATPFADQFVAAGLRYGVPPRLLAAVGWVESRYQTDAVSPAGALGMMQLMPFVADELAVDPYDPAQAIDGAARLLADHFRRFGTWDLALAAYNAGAGAVARAGNSIPTPGVAGYVRRVNERMELT
jgi:soluble lytic murein transglycosylase-like protein